MSEKIIIGITGTLGAGKGTIVDYLMFEKGFKHYSAREFIKEEIKKRGLSVNRDSMVVVGNDLRAKNSPSYIAEELYKKAKEDGKNAIIESLRTEGEVNSLREKGNFFLFSVDADPKIRYERISSRLSETDNVSFSEFVANEEREMTSDNPHKQNLSKCISLADYNFTNDGERSELHKQVDCALEIIQNQPKFSGATEKQEDVAGDIINVNEEDINQNNMIKEDNIRENNQDMVREDRTEDKVEDRAEDRKEDKVEDRAENRVEDRTEDRTEVEDIENITNKDIDENNKQEMSEPVSRIIEEGNKEIGEIEKKSSYEEFKKVKNNSLDDIPEEFNEELNGESQEETEEYNEKIDNKNEKEMNTKKESFNENQPSSIVSKRSDYISWDEYFMGIAKLSAHRSKDPNTQVGACIVNGRNKIIGIGYNGFPIGCSDDELPWARENKNSLHNKYPYVVHAEANAILNSTKNLQGARIYVDLFPCNECAKLIIQSGIKEIVYLHDKYAHTDGVKASKRMLIMAGVKLKKLNIIEKSINLRLHSND